MQNRRKPNRKMIMNKQIADAGARDNDTKWSMSYLWGERERESEREPIKQFLVFRFQMNVCVRVYQGKNARGNSHALHTWHSAFTYIHIHINLLMLLLLNMHATGKRWSFLLFCCYYYYCFCFCVLLLLRLSFHYLFETNS